MGLFRRSKQTPPPEAEPEERGANLAQAWAQVNAAMNYGGSSAGVAVTPESAMRNAAVWACVRQLTATITSLPVDVIRTTGNKRRTLATAEQPQIIRRPDVRISRRAWTGQVVRSLLLDGNAYGDIQAVDAAARPTSIATLAPGSVNWINGAPYVNGVKRDLWPNGDLWHLPVSFLLAPGTATAMSPVRMAAESIGVGLAAERFGAEFFGISGGKPIADLTIKGVKDPNDERVQSTHANFMDATRSRRAFVHGDGVELKEGPKVNPDDTQFIDLMRFEVEQACRWFGVPPAMVFAAVSGQNVTYANVGQADLHYYKHSVSGWLIDLEEALSEFIAGPQTVKFNVNAVLRMDALARAQVQGLRLQMKAATVNEVRSQEDEEPFDDPIYDLPGIPGDSGARTSPAPST